MVKMKRLILILSSITVISTGCGTKYQKQTFLSGGYSEIQTNPDSFIVYFKGNGSTSNERTLKYVLLRASELTIQNGYKHFVIVDTSDESSSYTYSSTRNTASASETSHKKPQRSNTQVRAAGSSNTYSGMVVKPGMRIKIKCFHEAPQIGESIDAEFYWNANKPS